MSDALEERLARVEQELEQLKAQMSNRGSRGGWISEITGSFKDDPEFDEILRLGKEARDADRPDEDK